MVDGGDVGFASLEGFGDAEEADNVAVVGVEELAGRGAVDADFVDLRGVGAGVLFSVLGEEGFSWGLVGILL